MLKGTVEFGPLDLVLSNELISIPRLTKRMFYVGRDVGAVLASVSEGVVLRVRIGDVKCGADPPTIAVRDEVRLLVADVPHPNPVIRVMNSRPRQLEQRDRDETHRHHDDDQAVRNDGDLERCRGFVVTMPGVSPDERDDEQRRPGDSGPAEHPPGRAAEAFQPAS